jgi:amino acid transporter
LPRIWSWIHPVHRTPTVAIVTYSSLVLALAIYGNFVWNATLSAIVRLLTYGLTCVALPVFRTRRPQQEPGFRLPAGGPISLLGASFCLWLLLTRTFSQAWVLGSLVLVGAVLFLAEQRRQKAPRV